MKTYLPQLTDQIERSRCGASRRVGNAQRTGSEQKEPGREVGAEMLEKTHQGKVLEQSAGLPKRKKSEAARSSADGAADGSTESNSRRYTMSTKEMSHRFLDYISTLRQHFWVNQSVGSWRRSLRIVLYK
jgi:hypothetical protein